MFGSDGSSESAPEAVARRVVAARNFFCAKRSSETLSLSFGQGVDETPEFVAPVGVTLRRPVQEFERMPEKEDDIAGFRSRTRARSTASARERAISHRVASRQSSAIRSFSARSRGAALPSPNRAAVGNRNPCLFRPRLEPPVWFGPAALFSAASRFVALESFVSSTPAMIADEQIHNGGALVHTHTNGAAICSKANPRR